MKQSAILAVALLFAAGSAFAQANPAAPAAKGLKITKITGTVNIMKDGKVLMTLKPGGPIPSIDDNKVSFSVVEGTIEVEANGKTITAATGSNFSVATTNGKTDISVAAGTPVAVKAASGHNIVVTANSEIRMTTVGGKMTVKVEKGTAVMTDATGGQTQALKAGETTTVGVTVAPAATTEETTVTAPESTVIESSTVQESSEVSGSTP
jgi:5-deoxy-D-glucuronate isomerase